MAFLIIATIFLSFRAVPALAGNLGFVSLVHLCCSLNPGSEVRLAPSEPVALHQCRRSLACSNSLFKLCWVVKPICSMVAVRYHSLDHTTQPW